MSDSQPNTAQLIGQFETYLKEQAIPLPTKANDVWLGLWQAKEYSLFSGGKRFRPLLSLYTAEACGVPAEKVLAWASAVEMIHTYSLIHDDLPCLDNDDLRRGQPTNHKKFGEPMALLAGDALLTEAFSLLARAYKGDPETAIGLVEILSEAAGSRGMIGGQVMDIADNSDFKMKNIELIHELKTGALIRAAVEGVAVIGRLPQKNRKSLRRFGELTGLAFQLADDLLDHDPESPEATSAVASHGLHGTANLLTSVSNSALEELKSLGFSHSRLAELIDFNSKRTA